MARLFLKKLDEKWKSNQELPECKPQVVYKKGR